MTHSLGSDAKAFLNLDPIVTVTEVRQGAAPDEPGIYGWWFDPTLLPDAPDVLTRGVLRLLYVGIAPSAPAKDGVRPRSLKDRLQNHIRGPIATSTLRRTLVALLRETDDFRVDKGPNGKWRLWSAEEVRLTNWMNAHTRVTWLTTKRPWVVEDELIKSGRPRFPLNIRGSLDPFAAELKRLRADAWANGTDPARFAGSADDIKMLGKVLRNEAS